MSIWRFLAYISHKERWHLFEVYVNNQPQLSKFGDGEAFKNFSDFGRPLARWLSRKLYSLPVTVVHVTTTHLITGLLGAYLLSQEYFITAAVLVVIKGILDAVDGELARLRNRPSYVGRYYDSLADTISTAAFFAALGAVYGWSGYLVVGIALLATLQISLSNFYAVLLRQAHRGDGHSRIDESECPKPYPWDNPDVLRWLHFIYRWTLGWQDRLFVVIHPKSISGFNLSPTLYSLSTVLGYGFQSLVFLGLSLLASTDLVLLNYVVVNNIIAAVLFWSAYKASASVKNTASCFSQEYITTSNKNSDVHF